MKQSVWLYGVLLAVCAGVFLRSMSAVDVWFALFLIFVGLAIAVLYYAHVFTAPQVLLLSVCVGVVGIGILRADISFERSEAHALDHSVGALTEIEGVVVREPRIRERGQEIVIDTGETGVIAYTDFYPEYSYGDRVRIFGTIQRPESFETDTGRLFNYPRYLAKDGIYYQLFYPRIELLAHGEGNVVKEKLFVLKHSFLHSVGKLIPEPHASLLGGLVVGAEESLGEELLDDFRTTGIIHIVVLSGYNVTIVAETIMRLFGFLPGLSSFLFGAFGIALFAIMTGGTATIVRASIMALLVLVARATGRVYDMTRALLLAGTVMVFHNPHILAFDPSFQLSFLATLGLILLGPLILERLGWVTSKWQLREFATATLATQIFVLPFLLFLSGKLSIVALPVNLLILSIIPLTMLVGFISGVVGMVSTTLALPVAYLAYAFLSYELAIVELFSRLPFASVSIPRLPVLSVIGIYVAYGLALSFLYKKRGFLFQNMKSAPESSTALFGQEARPTIDGS